MKNNKLYKYINLLLRIIIGVIAVWFIYLKLKDDFFANTKQLNTGSITYGFIIIAVLMLFVNWGIEAIKWRYAIRKIEPVTISKAFKLTITGITLGLITPNRIGEIPARALLLNTDSFKALTLKTMVASFSQLVITLLLGGIGFVVTNHGFNLGIDSIIIDVVFLLSSMLMLLIYFKIGKLEVVFGRIKYFREKEIFKALSEFSFIELTNVLVLSFLRYIVFAIQFWLVLKAFGIQLDSPNDVLLIPICFMFASFIPTLLISEIGVRGSVALFVFGAISDMDIQIILASVLLWIINVALPALMGLMNLKDVKLLKEK